VLLPEDLLAGPDDEPDDEPAREPAGPDHLEESA
jgi:hypothetical protein